MQRHAPTFIGFVLAVSAVVLHIGSVDAADAAGTATAGAAKSSYDKDRADCEAGRTAQDRATCLKEAGAAADEKKRNRLDNAGSARQNAVDRCNSVPASDKADCLARIEGSAAANQQTTTSGSVAGGGVIRETKTTTTGPAVVVVPAKPGSAPR